MLTDEYFTQTIMPDYLDFCQPFSLLTIISSCVLEHYCSSSSSTQIHHSAVYSLRPQLQSYLQFSLAAGLPPLEFSLPLLLQPHLLRIKITRI